MQPIQWFPGHMAKARREMTESLKKVDAVLELADARLPLASQNPLLREVVGHKPRVLVLTRYDLADPVQTARWIAKFESEGLSVVTVDARSGQGVTNILPALNRVAEEKRARDARRGIRPRPLRTMVVGIPNVGKSSLINRLAKRAATKTGDRPGITKTQQWIRLGQIELLDTPGVLWPKFESEVAAYALAMSGAIKSDILDLQSVCAYFLIYAIRHYPNALVSRFQFEQLPEVVWTDPANAWSEVEPLFRHIAIKRGLVRPGGVPDTERVADVVLREAQTGVLGRLTFERPE